MGAKHHSSAQFAHAATVAGPTFGGATLQGLATPTATATDGDSAAARRARRRWLVDAEESALVEALVEAAMALRTQATTLVDGAARWLGVDVGELVASPFGLRAALLGLAAGARVAHAERRPPLHWPAALQAGAASADPAHGQWHDGVLISGRHQGFALEAAHAGFDPNHSARWTPHELLHRAVGFAWWPAMDARGRYLAARAAELLPVVHWYGPDVVARLDEDGFSREQDARAPRAQLARAHWWHEAAARDRAALRSRFRRTLAPLRASVQHLERELAVIAQEAATGSTLSLRGDAAMPHADLDSSSDAIAYAVGHGRRLDDALVGAVLTAVSDPASRAPTIAALLARVDCGFDALIFGRITIDPAVVARRAAGRTLWDAALRLACAEGRQPAALYAALPALSAARDVAFTDDPTGRDASSEVVLAALERGFSALGALVAPSGSAANNASSDPAQALVLGLADTPAGWPRTSDALWAAGVASVAPALLAAATAAGARDALFAATTRDVRGPLLARLAEATAASDGPHATMLADLANAALAIAGATASDDAVTFLAGAEGTELVGSSAFAVHRFHGDVWSLQDAILAELAADAGGDVDLDALADTIDGYDDDDDGDNDNDNDKDGVIRRAFLVGRHNGEIAVVPCPAVVQSLWLRLARGAQPVGAAVAALDAELLRRDDDDVAAEDAAYGDALPADGQGWIRALQQAGAVATMALIP